MIEHLADGLADHMQLAAAAGAPLMIQLKPDVLAGQMRGQAWPLGRYERGDPDAFRTSRLCRR